MLRSDLRDYSDAYIVVKEEKLLQILMLIEKIKIQLLRITLNLDHAYQNT